MQNGTSMSSYLYGEATDITTGLQYLRARCHAPKWAGSFSRTASWGMWSERNKRKKSMKPVTAPSFQGEPFPDNLRREKIDSNDMFTLQIFRKKDTGGKTYGKYSFAIKFILSVLSKAFLFLLISYDRSAKGDTVQCWGKYFCENESYIS